MRRNLGTSLRRRRRFGDPMRDYDRLPPPLRAWLAQAALPWSPASCRRIWRRARAAGAPPADIIAMLDRAERTALGRDRLAPDAAGPPCREPRRTGPAAAGPSSDAAAAPRRSDRAETASPPPAGAGAARQDRPSG